MNILLFGATGMVGDGVLRRLIASAQDVYGPVLKSPPRS
jgi:uncharacterized protein YbjT (DUF2867 family)